MNILIVDDEASLRHIVKRYLSSLPDTLFFEACSIDEAIEVLKNNPVDIALVDIRLSSKDIANRDGQKIIKFIHENVQVLPIALSSISEVDEIKIAMKNGAHDYIFKETLSREVLVPIIENLYHGINNRILKQQIQILQTRNDHEMKNNFVGISQSAEKTRSEILRYAFCEHPVLITGPSGTGKEVVAKQLHFFSCYPDEPMLSINCGALPSNLIEAQLFGYKRGAFTGANENHPGFLQAVGKGTLFLDEIAELPIELQPKLLRVLENHSYFPLGTNEEVPFNGRIIAATHADLGQCILDKKFREDLYYRLNVLKIELQPLNMRREDIPLFVTLFIKKQHRKMTFTSGAMECLMSADWPGNVRQLRNIIDKIAILYDNYEITTEIVEDVLCLRTPNTGLNSLEALVKHILDMSPEGVNKLDLVESLLIDCAMQTCQNNKSRAARLLGIDRKVIQRRCENEPSTEDARLV